MRLQFLVLLIVHSWNTEANDQFLATEFEVLSDVLESVIFGVILRNDTVKHSYISENPNTSEHPFIDKEEMDKEQTPKSSNSTTLNSLNKAKSTLSERNIVKKRKRIKNIFHSGKLMKHGHKKYHKRKVPKLKERMPYKFFQSSEIKSKRHNSKVTYKSGNKQSLLSNEVESRLVKIKRLFDYVQKRKAYKEDKTDDHNKDVMTTGQNTKKANVEDSNNHKPSIEERQGNLKTKALEDLLEIAGDEWVKKNM